MSKYYLQVKQPNGGWVDNLGATKAHCFERGRNLGEFGSCWRVVERTDAEVSEVDFTYNMDGSVIKIGDILPTDFIHDVVVIGFTSAGKILARCKGSGQEREYAPDELCCSYGVLDWQVRANDGKGKCSWLTSYSPVDGADYDLSRKAAKGYSLEAATEIAKQLTEFALATHQNFSFTVIHTGGLS